MVTKLEKYLIESDNVVADDNYITDGYILLSKEFTENKVLKNFKTLQEDFMKYVPYYRGEDFELSKKCELLSSIQIGICLDDKNSFVDYKYVDMFTRHLNYTGRYYRFDKHFTKQPYNGGHLIKIFTNMNGKEIFAGAIMSIETTERK